MLPPSPWGPLENLEMDMRKGQGQKGLLCYIHPFEGWIPLWMTLP